MSDWQGVDHQHERDEKARVFHQRAQAWWDTLKVMFAVTIVTWLVGVWTDSEKVLATAGVFTFATIASAFTFAMWTAGNDSW